MPILRGKAVWPGPSLVIDTDSYAGQFERPITAFVTGEFDDEFTRSDVKAMAKVFHKEVGKVNPVKGLLARGLEFDDDVPKVTVCSLYPTPGMSNDGYGHHYQVTEDQPYRYPAYFSVRFFLHREPTPKQLNLIKQRAEQFAARGTTYQPPFCIVGYRILYERIVIKEKLV
ncbi:MAG: hypothetical protein AAB701_00385 [Patescibacteria group bacterium]|mgnify:CR=1 FL=1